LVTTMFMHGGLMHLLFNMYALWAFGTPLENIWGINRFVFFYFASGIGASLIYSGVNYYKFKSIYNSMLAADIPAENIEQLLKTKAYDPELFSAFTAETLAEFYHIFHIPAVGASGAIYGILVAFGMLFPNAKLALIFLPVPIPAKYFIPVLIAIDLFSGVTGFSIFGGGIAHFAHVGGAVIGFLLMLYWKRGNNVMM
jgi:membrane associated rhomboid family serine protease